MTDLEQLQGMIDISERFVLKNLKDAVATQLSCTLKASGELTRVSSMLRYLQFATRYGLSPLKSLCLQSCKESRAELMMSQEFNELFRIDQAAYAEIVAAITGKRMRSGM